MKKVFSALLAACLSTTACFPAFAASTENSVVEIEIEATQMNVTVPSKLAFIFNADGTNTYPTNATVTNNSAVSDIYLSKVDFDGNSAGWDLLKSDFDLTDLSVNEKATIFKMGLDGKLKTITPTANKDATGSATWTQSEFTIPATGTQTFAFEIGRGSFNQLEAQAPAYDVVMTYEFCTYA